MEIRTDIIMPKIINPNAVVTCVYSLFADMLNFNIVFFTKKLYFLSSFYVLFLNTAYVFLKLLIKNVLTFITYLMVFCYQLISDFISNILLLLSS